jgi:hypothetical protein
VNNRRQLVDTEPAAVIHIKRRERFPFVGDGNGNGHSFALKGQHKPARRNAAGNGLNYDFND